MFPYLLIFAIASALFLFAPKKQNWVVNVFLLLCILIAGLRDMIGGFDIYIYAEVYEYFNGLSILTYSPFEKGYLLYNYLLKLFSDKREFFFFMTAAIMVLLHFYTLKKHTPNIGISLFIYFCKFFLFSFVYLRQGLAMGIIWLGITYIIDKKYWYIIFLSILAFYFHRSSIIFIPFLFIAHYRFSSLQLGLLAFIVLFISLTPFSDLFFSFLSVADETGKIAAYAELSSGVNLFYLIEGFIGVILSILFQKYFYRDPKTTVIFNGFFLYSIIILAGLTNATFIRFSWYYFIFVVIALPYIYYFHKAENIQFQFIFKNLLFIYYALVFFRLLIVYDGGDLMPYKSIYQNFDRNGKWEFMEYRK